MNNRTDFAIRTMRDDTMAQNYSRYAGPAVSVTAGWQCTRVTPPSTLYATEVMSERVCARSPNGEVRIIADGVVGANGVTIHQDRIFMDECRPGGRMWELFAD